MTRIDLFMKKLLKEIENKKDVYKAEFGEYIPLDKATVGATFRLAEVTDDYVITALERCTGGSCRKCPRNIHSAQCIEFLIQDALKLIKTQKDEINILIRKKEALADEVADLQAEVKSLKEIIKEMMEEDGNE